MNRIAFAVFLAGLSLPAGPVLGQELGRDAVVTDLTFLRDQWAPKDRSFSEEQRRRMIVYVDEEIREARPMKRTELALEFAQAEAFANNAHTYSDLLSEEGLFHTLPITFWQFAEGPIVTRTHPDFTRLLGARIVSIGGHGYADAVARVAKFIPGTDQRRRYLAPAWLARVEVLEAVGLAKDGLAQFEFELPSGKHEVVRLGAAPGTDPEASGSQWRVALLPGNGPGAWPQILDHAATLPLFAGAPDEMTSTTIGDGSILYVRSTSLSPYEGEMTVMIKAYQIMEKVAKEPLPRDVIVDLRYNGGGNLFNVIAFSKELAGIIRPPGHIYVIEGRATFSAAIAFAAMLKRDSGGTAILVGEEPSDNPWFWSEGGTIDAPVSKLPLRYTDGYHDWAHGCTDLRRCYWPVVFHGAAVGSLTPDIPVAMRFSDYAAGKDPTLTAIEDDIARRRATSETSAAARNQ